jgi:hypothetical protein
MNLIDIE